MQKKKGVIASVCILIIIVVIIIIFAMRSGSSVKGGQAVTPTPVTLVAATMHNIPLQAEAIGSVLAPNTIMLKAQQAGRVKAVYFKPGQFVKKGQLLVQIDPAIEQADLSQALASYRQLKAEYQRYKTMLSVDREAVSQEILDEKYSAMEVAAAKVSLAKTALLNTQIIAPFSGKMGALETLNASTTVSAISGANTLIAVGSYLQLGDPVAIISDPNHLLVQYQLPQSDSSYLKLGQSIGVKTTAYPGKSFDGSVVYISPVILQTGYVFNIYAKINQAQKWLVPGMKVLVTHTLVQNRSVLVVPGLSLVPSLNGYSVYIVKNNKISSVPVEIGQRYGALVEITHGLKKGDEIVKTGLVKIGVGSSVKVVTP